jgi:predicted branched-subunit amino acid permease
MSSPALTDAELLQASRRRMLLDSIGIAASGVGEGLVYGLAARSVGLSPFEVGAMSLIVFAGGSQFAVLGYIGAGAPWLSMLFVTALINSRHLLYGAALSPYVANLPARVRAAMAYPLSDETFALTVSHFRRIGYVDVRGYFLVGLGLSVAPWVAASVVGAALAGIIAEPAVFGLDVVFPAAMAGLAVGLITDRRDIAAAISGALVGVAVGLLVDPAAGIVAGGVVGPIVGMLVPAAEVSAEPEASAP